jgi:phosphomannomutase/phosphoglucomutase
MESKRLFGTNGIRGITNEELTPEFALKIAYATGSFFRRGNILVGYDGRTSSPMLANAVTAGLISTGCQVYNGGMAPTPAIQYAIKHHRMDGGVMITASHNPPQYNGIKVMAKDGVELPREKELKIEKIFFNNKFQLAEWNALGEIYSKLNVLETYIEAVKRHADIEAIREKGYKIVVDAGNGVGSLTLPRLLREIGCQVLTLNANVDGTFPGRPSEPRPENLQELASLVKTVKADLGIALDGDADRAIFTDEKGQIHWGDRSFALIAKHFLIENPKETVVTPVSSSQLIKDVVDEYKGKLVWTKVGSITVARTMLKMKAKLGGEENGGVFYAPHHPVRDSAMTTILILNIMVRTGKRLSELLRELPTYYIEKGKVECPHELKQKTLAELTAQVKNLKVDTIDGVKIWFEDKSAILIRPSGTEPLYRLYAEAKTKQRAKTLLKKYEKTVRTLINKLMDRSIGGKPKRFHHQS